MEGCCLKRACPARAVSGFRLSRPPAAVARSAARAGRTLSARGVPPARAPGSDGFPDQKRRCRSAAAWISPRPSILLRTLTATVDDGQPALHQLRLLHLTRRAVLD